MPLTEEEKAYIHESARVVAGEIIKEIILAHIHACPHGERVNRAKWVLIGLFLGSSAAGGGGLVAGLIALFNG